MSANAQLGGHNVIFIHGFLGEDLTNRPDDNALNNRFGRPGELGVEGYITWSAAERIEGKNAQRIYDAVVRFSQQGLCDNGCVIVSHSTGDIVTRFLLDKQAVWLSALGLSPLKIVATIDLAGGSGGTELADYVTVADVLSKPFSSIVERALVAFGIPNFVQHGWGALYDLRPNDARRIGAGVHGVPRLRYAGIGQKDTAEGLFYDALIKGENDTQIPLHSSCGSATIGSYDSCSKNIKPDGRQASADAPDALWVDHYPVLMANDMNHGEMYGNATIRGPLAPVLTAVGSDVGQKFNTQTRTERPWYALWREDHYLTIADTDNKNLIRLIKEGINRYDATDGYFSLVNKSTGMCLDVAGGRNQNGQNVQQWHCNGTAAQLWRYEPGSGFIRNKMGRCLDNRGQTHNGGEIVIWDCIDINNMKFEFVEDTIRNRHNTSYVVDASASHVGANVHQWQHHGGNNQKWSWR